MIRALALSLLVAIGCTPSSVPSASITPMTYIPPAETHICHCGACSWAQAQEDNTVPSHRRDADSRNPECSYGGKERPCR